MIEGEMIKEAGHSAPISAYTLKSIKAGGVFGSHDSVTDLQGWFHDHVMILLLSKGFIFMTWIPDIHD
ncbi:hypothetical protein SADUNF_Sadunf17G0138500 [Salix dunnii]|uniref:Uncharacterized protein n=1 Tax=Salix dunnii TaxID=1413687 RepID=A0A835J923_9ROSI|nr:hypothetical protein SADUNF_Sadunf17G0138500 [Salix dunnii]